MRYIMYDRVAASFGVQHPGFPQEIERVIIPKGCYSKKSFQKVIFPKFAILY